MSLIIFYITSAIIRCIQALPLPWVALSGRIGGRIAFYLDARHRRVALVNLRQVFGGKKTDTEIYEIALENFCRIGENYISAMCMARMSDQELEKYCQVAGVEKIANKPGTNLRENRIVALGHFGNFELNLILIRKLSGYKGVSTYRGLRNPALNRILQNVRNSSGLILFERRTEASKLKEALNGKGIILGLFADQHAGNNGIWLPFLGTECSTSAAPPVFSRRYKCPIFTVVNYRVGLGRWRVEVGDEIPTHINGVPRSNTDIAGDMNLVFENAVLRDPANWFWVHRRWKPRPIVIPTQAAVPSTPS